MSGDSRFRPCYLPITQILESSKTATKSGSWTLPKLEGQPINGMGLQIPPQVELTMPLFLFSGENSRHSLPLFFIEWSYTLKLGCDFILTVFVRNILMKITYATVNKISMKVTVHLPTQYLYTVFYGKIFRLWCLENLSFQRSHSFPFW